MKLETVAGHQVFKFLSGPQNNPVSALLKRYGQGKIGLNVALRADRHQGNALQVRTSPYAVRHEGWDTSAHLQDPEDDLRTACRSLLSLQKRLPKGKRHAVSVHCCKGWS